MQDKEYVVPFTLGTTRIYRCGGHVMPTSFLCIFWLSHRLEKTTLEAHVIEADSPLLRRDS